MKQQEYILVTGGIKNSPKLDDNVNQKIVEGYLPYGAPYYDSGHSVSCQAMMREVEISKEPGKRSIQFDNV